MNSAEVIEKLTSAAAILRRFNNGCVTFSPTSLIESLASVTETVQSMQAALGYAVSLKDDNVVERLNEYRTELSRLSSSLKEAEVRLINHQQQLYGQITRLQRRSSWATSCKTALSDQIGTSLSIKG